MRGSSPAGAAEAKGRAFQAAVNAAASGRPQHAAAKAAHSLALVVLTTLVLAGAAQAYERPAKLNEVAAVYSLGVGEIRCPSQREWGADFASSFGYAYTNMLDDYSVLSPLVCAGVLGVASDDVPDWQQALGVLVLVHESFHLRRWRWRRNEGKVECQAMVYFKEAVVRLGASAEHAHSLYAYANALHMHKVSLFPQYRDRACKLTLWAPPEWASPLTVTPR